MDDERLLTQREAAAFLGISPGHLANLRHRGNTPGQVDTPPFIRIGPRSVRYLMSDLKKFIEERRVNP